MIAFGDQQASADGLSWTPAACDVLPDDALCRAYASGLQTVFAAQPLTARSVASMRRQ